MKFDFGPSAVAPGYTQVRKATAYGPTLGYGWGDPTKVTEIDRGGTDPLTRDFCRLGTDRTPFYVDVPNGNYRVTVTVGDANAKSGMSIRANGLFELASIGAAAGKFATGTFPIKVTTGRLRFEFIDASDPNLVRRERFLERGARLIELRKVLGAFGVDQGQ